MNPEFRMALPFLLDLAMPTVAYYVLHGLWGWSPVVALTVGGLLTAGHALSDAVRHRRANAFTVLVVFMIALSIALIWLTGDARFVLAKPAVFTAIAGAYCLGTCLVGRPLCFETAKPFATRGDPRRLAGWQNAWEHSPDFRRVLSLLTVAWGVGLLAESVARVVVAYALPMDWAVLAVQVPGVLMVLGILVVTRRLVPRLRRAVVDAEPVSPAS